MEQGFQSVFCLVTLNATAARVKVESYIAAAEVCSTEHTKTQLMLEIGPGLRS